MKPREPLAPIPAESALIQLLAVAPAALAPLGALLADHPELRPLYAALYVLVEASTKPRSR